MTNWPLPFTQRSRITEARHVYETTEVVRRVCTWSTCHFFQVVAHPAQGVDRLGSVLLSPVYYTISHSTSAICLCVLCPHVLKTFLLQPRSWPHSLLLHSDLHINYMGDSNLQCGQLSIIQMCASGGANCYCLKTETNSSNELLIH